MQVHHAKLFISYFTEKPTNTPKAVPLLAVNLTDKALSNMFIVTTQTWTDGAVSLTTYRGCCILNNAPVRLEIRLCKQ